MLEWTKAGPGAWLTVLVHHDDPTREYAYGEDSKVGTFSAELRDEAVRHGWVDEGRREADLSVREIGPIPSDPRPTWSKAPRSQPTHSLIETD